MSFYYPPDKEIKAQDYLKGKMKTIANASEGVIPGGGAYEKYGKMPGTKSSSTKAYSGPDKRNEMYAEDTDFGRNYRAGIYGGGEYDKDALAAKFGLDNSAEAEALGGEENVYGTLADGSQVFLGRMTDGLKSNADLIKAHSKQRHQDEGDHFAEGGELDSTGDVRGALLASWKAGDVQSAAEPEKERTPIEHSPEIKEAKERVRTYEDNVLSGKTSNDIYGNSNAIKEDSSYQSYDKYQLNLNKGQATVGNINDSVVKTTQATESFLDSKKRDVKKAYEFKPVT